jgi:type II secretory pathway pseudopilin PulG
VSNRLRGVALLEALVALALLGTVASAAAWSATESLRAVRRMHAREAEQRRAARLLSAVSLWPRADLDRHLGDRPQGAWRLEIDRTTPTIYVTTVRDSLSGAVLLQTALYRDETDR